MTLQPAVNQMIKDLEKAEEAFIAVRAREMNVEYGMDMREAASEAAGEWPFRKLLCAPRCTLCQFAQKPILDHRGKRELTPEDCHAHVCPWGKKA